MNAPITEICCPAWFLQTERHNDVPWWLGVHLVPSWFALMLIATWDAMTWKHFLHYWPFVLESTLSLVNSSHKGRVIRSFCGFVVAVWTNSHVSGDSRRHDAHVTSLWCTIDSEHQLPLRTGSQYIMLHPLTAWCSLFSTAVNNFNVGIESKSRHCRYTEWFFVTRRSKGPNEVWFLTK